MALDTITKRTTILSGDGSGYGAQVDIVGNLRTNSIDRVQGTIHAGTHYFYKDFVDVTGSGTITDILIGVPTGIDAHVKFDFSCEGEFEIQISEGATYSAVGTLQSRYNNNRTSSNTPNVLIYTSPTITGQGTVLWKQKIGGGGSVTGSTSGSSRAENEIIFAANTAYLVRTIKRAGGTDYFNNLFTWYEEDA